jgi:hypothetical protein
MARNPVSDVSLGVARDASSKSAQTVTFPVDVPLQAEYDATSGVLTIETPVVHAGEGPSEVVLRLRFTSAAACGFVRVLRALEDEGFSLADQSAGINLQ